MTEEDIVIVGSGVSGLAAAHRLYAAGRTPKILEARPRIGGRIHSFQDSAGNILGDLGPTWVWPSYQPIVRDWLNLLDLSLFDQFADGHAVIDSGEGQPLQKGFAPGQEGIARIRGYSQALIDALESKQPDSTIEVNSPVVSIHTSGPGVMLEIKGAEPREIRANQVIVAVPPRVALTQITWRPSLPQNLIHAMQGSQTWMAPHAKTIALYDRPVWRDNGLSGRIVGRAGPIVEAHDHSGPDGDPAAIFGFLGWPPQIRQQHAANLEAEISKQLERCFGISPSQVWTEDWARDPFTASPDDLSQPMDHPSVGPDILRAAHFDGRVVFAGAEVAQQSPGLIEGALVAAEHAARGILERTSP